MQSRTQDGVVPNRERCQKATPVVSFSQRIW